MSRKRHHPEIQEVLIKKKIKNKNENKNNKIKIK